MELNRCKTCKHFKRDTWADGLGAGPQCGGHCPLLMELLRTDNGRLLFTELYIQDTFGCIFHQEKELI